MDLRVENRNSLGSRKKMESLDLQKQLRQLPAAVNICSPICSDNISIKQERSVWQTSTTTVTMKRTKEIMKNSPNFFLPWINKIILCNFPYKEHRQILVLLLSLDNPMCRPTWPRYFINWVLLCAITHLNCLISS